jgi:hypothetical protein
MWKLKAFTKDGVRTIVQEWHAAQSYAVQAAFERRLEMLIKQPPAVWKRPYIGKLRKDCKGLYEIIFEVENIQHRPIGYYSGELEFTILAFATEKSDRFSFDVCKMAQARKALIEQSKEHAREFTFED